MDSKVVYLSKVQIERKRGPLRIAELPGEAAPVIFSVHDEIARHYGVDENKANGIACRNHRLCRSRGGWVNAWHLWWRAGSAQN